MLEIMRVHRAECLIASNEITKRHKITKIFRRGGGVGRGVVDGERREISYAINNFCTRKFLLYFEGSVSYGFHRRRGELAADIVS